MKSERIGDVKLSQNDNARFLDSESKNKVSYVQDFLCSKFAKLDSFEVECRV